MGAWAQGGPPEHACAWWDRRMLPPPYRALAPKGECACHLRLLPPFACSSVRLAAGRAGVLDVPGRPGLKMMDVPGFPSKVWWPGEGCR